MPPKIRLISLGAALAVLAAAQPRLASGVTHPQHAAQQQAERPPSLRVPEPIRLEHEHLHRRLASAVESGGRTGAAAGEVQRALAGHFEEENALVMPLLGLLAPLAEGRATEAMRPAIEMARQVKAKLPAFMSEHRAIHEAVGRLESAATSEGRHEAAEFARALALHAQHEEAVLYPAAIVVGQRLETILTK